MAFGTLTATGTWAKSRLVIGPVLEVGGAGRRDAVCDGKSRPD